jgi:hypothetical protein
MPLVAQTRHIEMRASERWADVVRAFLGWCVHEKNVSAGGCHEGDAARSPDGKRYAAISVPDHSPDLITYLGEWAAMEGRAIW